MFLYIETSVCFFITVHLNALTHLCERGLAGSYTHQSVPTTVLVMNLCVIYNSHLVKDS